MSKARALKAFNLEITDRVPCQEWIDHPEFITALTGLDPFEQPAAAVLATIGKLDLDWYGGIPQQSHRFRDGESAKTLADGNYITEWGFTGSLWEKENKFSSEEEVLSYNPLEDSSGKVRIVSRAYRDGRIKECVEGRKLAGESALITGLYYTMLFQCFIMAFGWEMFLVTAASEPGRFRRTIELFAEFSLENTREWAALDAPVFWCHDDLAISRGLVFPPGWYRENIFPHYERILEPIKRSGKKIVFVSDGNYGELVHDLFALGIDGVMVDNYVELEPILSAYGGKKVVVGNVDTRILTQGDGEDVRREVKRCMDLGKRYPGYFIKASGDLPQNIPLRNIQCYFECCRELGAISAG